MEASAAIERSISHNEIVYCDDTPENRYALLAASSDSVENGSVTEYWGESDGEPWRVHIERN